jgi:hypothetical protein
VKFATLALHVGQAALPASRSKFSKHRFQQPQLLTIVCLMRYEDRTFREADVRLAEHAERRQAGGDQTTALATVETVIERAVQDHQAWAEIGALIEQRRKLVESESKRMATLQQMLTTEQALSMMRTIVDILTRHVSNKQALSAIIVELQRMAGPVHELPADAADTDA